MPRGSRGGGTQLIVTPTDEILDELGGREAVIPKKAYRVPFTEIT